MKARYILMIMAASLPLFLPNGETKAQTSLPSTVINPGIVMVSIPGGTFVMGSTVGEEDELPLHNVTVSNFEIANTEVTVGQYEYVMNGNGVNDSLPQAYITWYDMARFCNKLSIQEGLDTCYSTTTWECDFTKNGFRLPTEAEWEYACRAGTTTEYNTGTSFTNYAKGKVARYAPNAWGLYDMHGNVTELCNDWYGEYSSADQVNPTGRPEPGPNTNKVVRGGSYVSPVFHCRSGARWATVIGRKYNTDGFRIARGNFLGELVSIDPVTVDTVIAPGTGFWVEIKAKNIEDMFGSSFILNFTETDYFSIFSADSVVKGDFLGNDVLFTSMIDAGKVSIGITQKQGAAGVTGNGVLARVKFVCALSTPVGTTATFFIGSAVSITPTATEITTATHDIRVHSSGIIVWPGDADNSGLVDQADILPLGIYWANTGNVRPSATREWTPQACIPWTPEAATHADCDGSGTVDQADVLPIGINWHKGHVLLASAGSMYPAAGEAGIDKNAIELRLTENSLNPGEYILNVDLNYRFLNMVHGLSFTAESSAGEITRAEPGSAWSNNALFFQKLIDGKLYVGVTERPESKLTGSEYINLVKIYLPAGSSISGDNPVELQDILLSLNDGRIVSLSGGYQLEESSLSSANLPKAFALAQNSPNPFNPSTTIEYAVPEGRTVTVRLKVFDIRGRLVRTLFDGSHTAGRYSTMWDGTDQNGRDVASGVYFYRIEAGDFSATRKMVMLK